MKTKDALLKGVTVSRVEYCQYEGPCGRCHGRNLSRARGPHNITVPASEITGTRGRARRVPGSKPDRRHDTGCVLVNAEVVQSI